MGFRLRTPGIALLFLGFGLVGCARRETAPTDPAVPVVSVSAEVVNNLVIVPVKVNGSAAVPFILDTGASSSVVDRADVRELGLTLGEDADATTGGGRVAAAAIRNLTFEIGGINIPATNPVTMDLSGVETGLGHHIAGILGSDIFKQRVVEIDYAEQTVRLHDARSFHYLGPAKPLVISIDEGVPFVNPVFVRPDGSELDAKLEFDTGQSGALTLIKPFVDGADLTNPSQPILKIATGAIFPGKVSAYVTRLNAIRLEDSWLKNVVTNVTPTAEDAGVSGATMGLMGGEVLRRFRIFVDYSRSQAFLEPNDHSGDPFEFDMSGISLASQGPLLNEYRARSVIAGSPASEAGVSAGDLLTAIEGRATQTMTLSDVRRLFRQPDRQFALELKRGERRVQMKLKTRKLI